MTSKREMRGGWKGSKKKLPSAHRCEQHTSQSLLHSPSYKEGQELAPGRKNQTQTHDFIMAVPCHHINLVLENFKYS